MPDQADDQALLRRIQSAAVVAIGRVRDVRKIETPSLSAQGARISEHDPGMAEAVIDVNEGIKGTASGKELRVRFPTSTDVMWYSYPKFEVGASGIFFLQPDTLTPGAKTMAAGPGIGAFNAKGRGDVMPLDQANRVREAAQQLERKKD